VIIYEVTLAVQREVAAEYETWLITHIEEMLFIDGFVSATLSEAEPTETIRTFITDYLVRDQKALDDYFARHAAKMRAVGVSKFGDKFTASRRILTVKEEFKK
jgi:hypothetical protein